jgi:CheY-like chemotaxis protein
VSANSSGEGFRIANERQLAVAVIDIRMPDMGGFEMAERLRANERTQHLPIIFVSASESATKEIVNRAYSLGAVDFFTTPIDPTVCRLRFPFSWSSAGWRTKSRPPSHQSGRNQAARNPGSLRDPGQPHVTARVDGRSHRVRDVAESVDYRQVEDLQHVGHEGGKRPVVPCCAFRTSTLHHFNRTD